jgi:hypothetical protein
MLQFVQTMSNSQVLIYLFCQTTACVCSLLQKKAVTGICTPMINDKDFKGSQDYAPGGGTDAEIMEDLSSAEALQDDSTKVGWRCLCYNR